MGEWLNVAKQNNISEKLYKQRIQRGWTPEKAATVPRQVQHKNSKWIKLARQNGISYQTFYSRVKELNWDPEKAATILPPKRSKWPQIAKKNNISYTTYFGRIKRGWSPEKAATVKPKQREDKHFIELAKKNGIPPHTYRRRVDELFWSPEEASTVPVMSRKEVLKIAREHRALAVKYRHDKINRDKNNLFKLTREHLDKAREIGLDEKTVRARVYYMGWTVQKAITTPKKERKYPEEYYKYREIAKENNISPATFHSRVFKLNWSFEEAATKPIQQNKRTRNDGEWIEKALQNGINYYTYWSRVEKRGWSPEEAATTPPLKADEFLNDETKQRALEGFKKFRLVGRNKGSKEK